MTVSTATPPASTSSQQTEGSPRGLSSAEVEERIARGEVNVSDFGTTRSYGEIIRQNGLNPINVVLYGLAAALVLMGRVGDAVVTAGLVLLNVAFAVFQESRAKRRLDRISLLNRPRVRVIRDGKEQEIPQENVVKDDLLVVNAGDQIVVDGRIVSDTVMAIDESMLTGESDPVIRQKGDQVLSGSFVVNGSGLYVAEVVGEGTQANQITESARRFRQVTTPLQHEINMVLRTMVLAVVVVAGPVALDLAIRGIVLISNWLRLPFGEALERAYYGYPFVETVQGWAVTIGLIPQGLSFMVTVSYVLAAVRISGKGALVQAINSVESLSHVDVLCLDKTGTLTTNRLTFERLKPFSVDEAEACRLIGDLAENTPSKNGTIAALHEAMPGTKRDILAEIPFDSKWKWSAVTLAPSDSHPEETIILGAPDILVPHLADGPWHTELDETLHGWAQEGLRILMVATPRSGNRLPPMNETPHLPNDLVPIALVALADEIRPDAEQTLKTFVEAGVELKLISGDFPETVSALAKRVNFPNADRQISGQELERLNDEELGAAVERHAVFGRITPELKARIVKALKAQGHYVAMTGDGVNDVPSLKEAQVGIALVTGSQAARAVADIVLLEGGFAVLPRSVREGRRITAGMQEMLRIFLTRSVSILLFVLGVLVVSEPFPVIPKHASITAFFGVGIPSVVVAYWATDFPTNRSPIRTAAPFFLPAALWLAFANITVYLLYLRLTEDTNLAQTVVTLMATLCSLGILPLTTSVFPERERRAQLTFDRARAWLAVGILIVLVSVLSLDWLRAFFELSPLRTGDYFVIVGGSIAWLWVMVRIWRNRLLERALGLY